MKKDFLVAAVCFAAMVGCNKNVVPTPDEKVDAKYVLYAEDINSKTVTDASFNVAWADNDNLAVYTWPAGTDLPTDAAVWRKANPVNFETSAENATPRPFSLMETEVDPTLGETPYADRLEAFKARFDASASLDWGVIYPGKMSNASRPGMGVVVFGDDQLVRSRQEGNDNMSHLAFQDVLWGKASGKSPVVQMKHLGTMMVYTVENASENPFTVTSIKITVNGANIGGQFRVKVFDGTFDSCMTALHECTLWVADAAAIPVGGSAKFYQVLAPFSLNAGNMVTMTVVTDKGSWTKTTTLASAKSFESGKQNTATLPVSFGTVEDVTLTQHNTDEIWFSSDSNSGGYFNLETGMRFTYGQSFNTADMDMVVFRGSGKTALTLCAPTDTDMQAWIDNSVKDWPTKNDTKFKKVEVDFDAVTKHSELKSAYDAATGEAGRCVLTYNETAIVKTVDGKYALVKLVGGTKYGDAWGSYQLSLKTVE